MRIYDYLVATYLSRYIAPDFGLADATKSLSLTQFEDWFAHVRQPKFFLLRKDAAVTASHWILTSNTTSGDPLLWEPGSSAQNDINDINDSKAKLGCLIDILGQVDALRRKERRCLSKKILYFRLFVGQVGKFGNKDQLGKVRFDPGELSKMAIRNCQS